MSNDYQEFLKRKIKSLPEVGFQVSDSELNAYLYDFQRFIVKRALKAGRYAIFADCGLGKTLMQLSFADAICKRTGAKMLILAPLAVAGQTIKEGARFGIEVCRAGQGDAAIHITNYEQLDNINPSDYIGVVLDESSILKSYMGETKQAIIKAFATHQFKLACTATPAPNDYVEIGNHSEFLNVMDSSQMLTHFFISDRKDGKLRLKGHAEKEFYGWIASWASVLRNPSDIGFYGESEKYRLPELNMIERVVKVPNRTETRLFNESNVNATQYHSELKFTMAQRIEQVAEIVNASSEPFIVWVEQDAEEEKVVSLIPDAIAVRGSDAPKKKEDQLLGFARGEFRVLVTKKKIAQFGLNYQHCRNQVFASLDFSFEGVYQAIRRSYRFGQKQQVNIYLVTTDTMENVLATIEEKHRKFEKMMTEITNAVNNKSAYKTKFDYTRRDDLNEHYHLINGDSCEEIKTIESNSIDFSIFSPPFSTLYTYSDSFRDMGNCADDKEFIEQQHFLLTELYRVMRNGRLVAVHTKDLPRFKTSSGYSGMYDFTGDYHRAMERAGFKYHSKITIWIDPVLEMQRTKVQRLLYSQVTKDSSYSGIGMPEYVTIFRKWEGDQDEWKPINNKTKNNFDLDTWQEWASPIWAIKKPSDMDQDFEMMLPLLSDEALSELPKDILEKYATSAWFDIQRTNVLNNYTLAKSNKDEKHICPLQLDIIERCIKLWSNKGEVVFTPFAGIGSEVYTAVKCGRKGIGIELKESYFDIAKSNCRNAIEKSRQKSLFDF